jgi:hypothetical protein
MYKTWQTFYGESEMSLLNTVLTFTSMDKGVMHYSGEYEGKKLHCSVSEHYVCSYNYSAQEAVNEVTQGEFVVLVLGDVVIMNTY